MTETEQIDKYILDHIAPEATICTDFTEQRTYTPFTDEWQADICKVAC